MSQSTINLITQVPFPTITPSVDYQQSITMLGSCFTQHIGKRLQQYGFNTCINPFGIIFNPLSLGAIIHRVAHDITFTSVDCEDHFSYLAHSDIYGDHNAATVASMNNAAQDLKNQIRNSSHVFITLGTAWVYRHIEKNMVVANCHKQQAHLFHKELLSIENMNVVMNQIIADIANLNPQAKVVFTLSPVRHIKDGFVENMRSKARIHEVIQNCCDTTSASYLPVYEFVMDQLRDYRFYGRDLVHLNELGIDMIWLRFRESVIKTTCFPLMSQIEKYRKLEQHRPKNAEKHQLQLQEVREELLNTYPFIRL